MQIILHVPDHQCIERQVARSGLTDFFRVIVDFGHQRREGPPQFKLIDPQSTFPRETQRDVRQLLLMAGRAFLLIVHHRNLQERL